MKLVYPAIFYTDENGTGYTVEIPDLKGCTTEGDTLADAILMGTDAACGWLLDELEDGHPLPTATDTSELKVSNKGFINLLVLDMDSYSEKFGKKSVRKNITIPAYMDTYIETHNISISKLVQDSITDKMQNFAL